MDRRGPEVSHRDLRGELTMSHTNDTSVRLSPLRVDQVLVSELIGGAAQVAIRLAEVVRNQGGQSRAWVPGPGPAATALKAAAIPVCSYRLDDMKKGRVRHALACLRMARNLLGERLVHVHTPSVYRLMSPALRLARARSVVHVQIEPGPEELRWAFRDPPDLIVTCAEYLVGPVQRVVEQAASRPVRVLAIPNAIELNRFKPGDRPAAKAALGASITRPLVLMMANLAPHKGQATALQAVAWLSRHNFPVDCWFAGEERDSNGSFRTELEQLARALGITHQVRFLGYRRDGPELLRAADILLLPSTHEGLPISILEAQATGTAVVAAPEPGIREIVEDGITGFLVPAADHNGYAARIRELLVEPTLYQQVTRHALQQVVRRYSWETFTKDILKAYRLAVAPVQAGQAVDRREALSPSPRREF
jgi:glycosyltransferase involved in cell wall biosynthesis